LVSNLLKQGHDAMAIRLALISHHYRSDHMWVQSDLDSAQQLLDGLRVALSRMEVAPTNQIISEVIAALANDLDTPTVIASLRTWLEETNRGEVGGSAGELSRALDTFLGIAF
jgi:L-cysteine:1D-myo-inositol 2-amino-2-deoxy-alpha-D-glucopyranoside ligase